MLSVFFCIIGQGEYSNIFKISNLNIVNGSIGTDKSLRNYTYPTTNGQSTIDYMVMSMALFPKTMDSYIDTMDKCMSDVHCPVS